jgi:dephospho-CoA kinase
LILGLTGGYCSGKSSAAAVLRSAGWSVIDVDALGHAALERSIGDVAALLGPSALKPDGSPDRRAIGSMVFGNADLLERYEAIVHPAMNALVMEAVSAAGTRVCVDAALLYRLPMASACDAIIEVRSPLVARLLRGKNRDGLGMRAILARIARQRPLWVAGRAYEPKTVVVQNAGSRKRFHAAICAAVDRVCSFARA